MIRRVHFHLRPQRESGPILTWVSSSLVSSIRRLDRLRRRAPSARRRPRKRTSASTWPRNRNVVDDRRVSEGGTADQDCSQYPVVLARVRACPGVSADTAPGTCDPERRVAPECRPQCVVPPRRAAAQPGGTVEDLVSSTPLQGHDRIPGEILVPLAQSQPRSTHPRTEDRPSDVPDSGLLFESVTLEYPHLRRRPERLVLRPDRQEPHRVAEPPGDAFGPVLKLLPGPLEAVVGMPELLRPRRSPTSRCTPGSASSARPSAAWRTRTQPARRPTAGAGRGARRPRPRRRRRSPPAACPGT